METKSILIISIVAVVAIAAFVTAYQVTEGDPLTILNSPNTDDNTPADGDSNTPATGTGGSASGTGSGSGSDSGYAVSYSRATEIVNNNYIGEPGCYAGSPSLKDGIYYVPIYNKQGKHVGTIYIDAKTGENLGGEGGG